MAQDGPKPKEVLLCTEERDQAQVVTSFNWSALLGQNGYMQGMYGTGDMGQPKPSPYKVYSENWH